MYNDLFNMSVWVKHQQYSEHYEICDLSVIS